MRTPVFNRPKNDIRILRLATGYAVVTLYASYVETPKELLSTGVGTFDSECGGN